MVVTFLIWLNIFTHSLLWGDFFTAVLHRLIFIKNEKNNEEEDIFVTLFVGLVGIASFAQLFHFFHRFDMYAQALLSILSALFLLFRWSYIRRRITTVYLKLKNQSRVFIVGAALLSFSLLVLSSDSPSFYDTDLYHAQTVKWAEQYPVVIGLGNLYSAFALNSSIFTLHALFSFHFISGQSMHAVSGFIILLFLLYCYWLSFFRDDQARLPFFNQLFSIFLLLFFIFCPLFTELAASLAPDIAANIFGFLTFILIIKAKQDSQISDSHIFKILLFATFAVSAKLSMIFMLAVPFLYWRFYFRNWRNFLISMSIVLIIMGPYLLKTVLLSGYLLYPFYWLDVLQVNWKMSHQAIYEEMMWIRSWNRVPGETFTAVMGKQLYEWLPIWYVSLKPEDKFLVLLLPIIFFISVVQIIFSTKKKLIETFKTYVDLYSMLLVGTFIWFFGSPDPRFGYAFFITLLILLLVQSSQEFFSRIWFVFLQKTSVQNYQTYYFYVLLLVIGLFFLKKTNQDKFFTVFKDHLLIPRDYDVYKVESKSRDGLTFYYPEEGDRMGYEAPLPSTPYRNNQFSLRGPTIADGFKFGD